MPNATKAKRSPRPGSEDTGSRHSSASARLFAISGQGGHPKEGSFEHVPLAQIVLARNPRRQISAEGIDRLASMLMCSGQLVAAIGRRVGPEEVLVYAGQRRLLAARRTAELAGNEGYEDLRPVRTLLVRLLDYTPGEADIRRIQAQENQHEDLCLRDKQEQFADCWSERVGLGEEERLATVCRELGIAPTLAWNLRRQLTLPEELRERIAERPTGDQLSITMANRLADMAEISPSLMQAVAGRISTSELHQQALCSLGEFVQRTVIECEGLYAVRIEEGASMLDGHEQIERARAALSSRARPGLAQSIGCKVQELDRQLRDLSAKAQRQSFKLDIDRTLRQRAATGGYAWVFDRGADYAAAMWVIAPEFMIAVIHEAIGEQPSAPLADESYFGAAGLTGGEVASALAQERERREQERKLKDRAAGSNLGLGYDIATGLLDPRGEQLDALREIVVRLIALHYPSVIAYGAGWTSRDRQRPVGESGRFEPMSEALILDAECRRALEDPDPLRGIAQLLCRWAAAFLLDPAGVPRTTTLGFERMSRKLQGALPSGEAPLREALWRMMRPMLSPHLTELNREEFVLGEALEPSVDLAAARADKALADLDLGEEQVTA